MRKLQTFGRTDRSVACTENEQVPLAGQPQDCRGWQAAVEHTRIAALVLGRLGPAATVLSEVSRRADTALGCRAELLTGREPAVERNLGLRVALEEAIWEVHRASPYHSP
ncbi:hypothetical protein ACFVU0_18005 [Streptomyces sp. NPDC058122]|uniref:hypothetical protein n=1 Tax=Streptomyces sp. NPDC058122 TaxID=3346349 RepID=UPI0036EFC322